MGKKISQSSLKISKEHHQKQQQFNTLIKVLKPKVYITDSSNFKKLVQELTGNGTTSNCSSSTTYMPPPHPLEPNMVIENCPLVRRNPETAGVDVWVSTSNSSSELCYNDDDALMLNEEFNQFCNQICLQDAVFLEDSVTKQPLPDQFLECQNLESFLFDVEPIANPLYSNFYAQIEQQLEASIYDYDMSGLL